MNTGFLLKKTILLLPNSFRFPAGHPKRRPGEQVRHRCSERETAEQVAWQGQTAPLLFR